jgi:two-component system, NarL family, response regulator DevR
MPSATPVPLLLLVLSDRPAVQAYFADICRENGPFDAVPCPLSDEGLARGLASPGAPRLALVDVPTNPRRAIAVCKRLRQQAPDLPVLALFCCADAATPERLRALLAAGVNNALDLSTPTVKMAAVLEEASRGNFTLRLDLNGNQGYELAELLCADAPIGAEDAALTEEDRQLLALLTHGLTDEESSRHLQMSEHTVRHHLQRLWERLALRNRTELAAWAGRAGLYAMNGAPSTKQAGE